MMDQKLTRRSFIEGSGLAALLAVGGPALLAACGANTSTSKGSSSLRIGLLTDQDTLNVFTSVDAPEFFCCVYDKLMVYDAHLSPQLSLAKTKTASTDGLDSHVQSPARSQVPRRNPSDVCGRQVQLRPCHQDWAGRCCLLHQDARVHGGSRSNHLRGHIQRPTGR